LHPAEPKTKISYLKGDLPNRSKGRGLRQVSQPLAHALPTFSTADPDLALIMGVWDRLTDEIKARLIEMARAKLCAVEQ
jgi:hypothetical protein